MLMKKYFMLLVILSILSCSDTPSHTQDPFVVHFNSKESKAVLIGQKIDLLGVDTKPSADISHLNGRLVDLIGVSDSLYNINTGDICDAFWYAKIKSDNIEGIVNGKHVYEINDSDQDTSFTVNGNSIDIFTTDFLSIGLDHEGDLVGCTIDQPIVIKDKKNNYFGLVDLIPNQYAKKINLKDISPFFEIKSDESCFDKIKSITIEKNNIRLGMHRSWLEEKSHYEVLLTFANNRYSAEYQNVRTN
jgi:hypothetical protein